MDYVAIDVETANADFTSICQVGFARFAAGELVENAGWLVDPRDYFDPFNVEIHGITPAMVHGQPTWPELYPMLRNLTEGRVVVSHTHFDRTAINGVNSNHGLPELTCTWLDSAMVARRAFPDVAQRGYGLKKLAKKLGIAFKHHDAVEDARAAGEVLRQAIAASGMTLDDWLTRVRQPITQPFGSRVSLESLEANPDGPLFGEEIVFTGTLAMPRAQAAAMAAAVGCAVASSVKKKTTTLLVVGKQDDFKLAGYEKSSKHRKAEELIAGGADIRIITEDDFLALIQ